MTLSFAIALSIWMLKEKSVTMPPRAKPAAPWQRNVIDLMGMLKRRACRSQWLESVEGPQAPTSGRRGLKDG